jgi:acyl-CoA synthetase (AMP-forming)/AMP-acid ligase II
MSRPPFPGFAAEYRRRFVDAGLWLDVTLQGCFDEVVRRLPDHVAIVAGDRRITFAAWAEESRRLAAGLVRLGLRKGDIVTVQIPNWPELCILQIALARIGAVIQPMHMVYREREIESMLRFCHSRAVILPGFYQKFDHATAVDAMRSNLGDLEFVITAREAKGGDVSYESLLESDEGLDEYLSTTPIDADDVLYLNFTSGTEGAPKGFLHTHNTLVSVMKRFSDMTTARNPDSKNDVVLANSPMTHSFGHLTTYQVILRGIRMVLVERFSPGEILNIIERERVTSLSGTPAHLISLLSHPALTSTDLRSVKSVGVGGAQCPPELQKEIQRVFSVGSGNMYGMGENIVHTQTLPDDPPEVVRDTVGKPVPGAELKIFAPDRVSEQPLGEVGEIAYRGPSLFLAYYDNPERTAETRNADGWFFTGDLGFVDERGYLHLAGRKKELINRGGTKIFPKEIEDLLHAHPKVLRAAVIGMPDLRLGERVCAFVELRAGEALTLEEVKTYFEGHRVMKYNIPERLEVIDELPQTPTGKIKKEPLFRMVTEALAAEQLQRDSVRGVGK